MKKMKMNFTENSMVIPMMRMNTVIMMRYNEWTCVYNKYFFITFVIGCCVTILTPMILVSFYFQEYPSY